MDAPEPASLYAMSGGGLVGAGVGANAVYDGSLKGATVGIKLAEGSNDGTGVMDGTAVGCNVGNILGRPLGLSTGCELGSSLGLDDGCDKNWKLGLDVG